MFKMGFLGSWIMVLVMLASPLMPHGMLDSGALDGPTRGPGLDINVNITSHYDGQFVTMDALNITADLNNSGTLDFAGIVWAQLSIYFPANGTFPTLVFQDNVSLGGELEWVGNTSSVTFAGWTPANEGSFLVSVSTNASDDHLENNTDEITLVVVHGEEIDVDIWGAPLEQAIPPGKSTLSVGYDPFRFTVRNTGIHEDTYNITILSAWVMPGYVTVVGPLGPGEISAELRVHVEVPWDAQPSDLDQLIFTATSRSDPDVEASVTVTTKTVPELGVEITVIPEVKEAFPGGDWVSITFGITNVGNVRDGYDVSLLVVPSSWSVILEGSDFIVLNPGRYGTVRAWVHIPELNYETMEQDLTYFGATGNVILQLNSPDTHYQASAQGTIRVGLIHTVQIEISPPSRTIGINENGGQPARSFNISLRAVDNILEGGGRDLNVTLSLPEGPNGVEFTPFWVSGPNETESEKWSAGIPEIYKDNMSLEGGVWHEEIELQVIVPTFPLHGTARIAIRAEPFANETFPGVLIPKTEEAIIHVEPYLNFTVEPQEGDQFTGAPGDKIMIPFNVTNIGNTWDSYTGNAVVIVPEGGAFPPEEWDLTYPNGVVAGPLLPRLYDPVNGEFNGTVWVRVQIPDGAPIGDSVTIDMIITSSFSMSKNWEGPPLRNSSRVTITILQGFGVDLEPEESEKFASPNERIPYRLNITNNGNGFDTYAIESSFPSIDGWTVELEVVNVQLDSLERDTIVVWVTPSMEASADEVLPIKVRATSYGDPYVLDDVWINTTVQYVSGGALAMAPSWSPLIWRHPGEVATFTIDLVNLGNGNDTFDLRATIGSPDWYVEIDTGGGGSGSTASAFIPRGGSIRFRVNVTLPGFAEVTSLEELEALMIVAGMKMGVVVEASAQGDRTTVWNRNLTVGVLQEFRSTIKHTAGYGENLEVLVGEAANYRVYIENMGNGLDNLTVIPGGSMRHLSWLDMYAGPYSLAPFTGTEMELFVVPNPNDLPGYGEVISYSLASLAGDDQTYRTIALTCTIVMSRLGAVDMDVDLGAEASIVVTVCNMPDAGETPTPGIPMLKNHVIRVALDMEGDFSEGWSVATPYTYLNMTYPYEIRTTHVSIMAPPDLLANSYLGRFMVVVDGGLGKEETDVVVAHAVYFDAFISQDLTTFSNLYEGGKGKAAITIMTYGTRPQENITVMVTVGGEVVEVVNTGPANPQFFLDGQPLVVTVEFDLPSLKWYEKGKEWDIEIVIDPEDRIVENTIEGGETSESNNVLTKQFTVKNYVPGIPFMLLSTVILIIITLAGVIGFFFLDRRDSWFLLLLAPGLTGMFALLFYIPLEQTTDASSSNSLGLLIILLNLLLIIPALIFLYTRSGDAYILHRIRKARGDADDENLRLEATKNFFKPYMIAFLGGLLSIAIPVLLWTVPGALDSDQTILNALTGEAAFPVWALLIIVPLASLAIQALLQEIKKSSLRSIISARYELERLRDEIKEGLD